MPLPSSGPLGIDAIRTELQSASGSLRTLSSLAGFSTPDAISEFYGYSFGLPSGLVAGYRQSSYPGSGTTWNDISGNSRNMTLVNPSWDSSWGYFNSGSTTDFQIPGSAALYSIFSGGQNFTWILRAGWETSYQDFVGLFWAEDAAKNFLIGMWYPHTGSNFVPRADSCCESKASWNAGEPDSNTGPSPSQASFDWRDNFCSYFPMLIIRGTLKFGQFTLRFHGMNDANNTTPVFLWQTSAFSYWGSNWNTTQPIHVMCRSAGNYYSLAKLACVYMFNKGLTDAECKQVYDFDYPTAYAC